MHMNARARDSPLFEPELCPRHDMLGVDSEVVNAYV